MANHYSYYKFGYLTVLHGNFIPTRGLVNRPLSINGLKIGFTEERDQVVPSRKKLNYTINYMKIGELLTLSRIK